MNDHVVCAIMLFEATHRAKQAELQVAALQQEAENLKKPDEAVGPREVKDAD